MKNVLITGGAGGLGLAAAKYLAERGCRVFSCDIVKYREAHANITQYIMDVRDTAAIQAVFDEVEKVAPELDAVIHLSGLFAMDSFIEIDEKELANFIDVNIMGVYRVNKVFLPLLRKHGRIVITTSEVAGLNPFPFAAIYSLVKTALEHYARALRLELCLLGVSVVELKPGAFTTAMTGSTGPALDRMIAKTQLYKMNTLSFKKVMEGEIGKGRHPDVLAKVVGKIVEAKDPKPVYKVRNSLFLKLFSILPLRMQVRVIRKILK